MTVPVDGIDVPAGRHPAVTHYSDNALFAYGHLPNEELQDLSGAFARVAQTVIDVVSDDNPETAKALGKILEAKDAAVRALLIQQRKARIAATATTAGGQVQF